MTVLGDHEPSAARRPSWPAAVLAVSLTVAASCAHVSPYYRDPGGRWSPWVADADVAHRLILIGDAGDPDPGGEPALRALATQVNRIPTRTTIVFLGDNIYETGMPPPAPPADPAVDVAVQMAQTLISPALQTRQDAERKLDAQIAVVRGNGARAIFVPGNHDWDQFAPSGRPRIAALESYLDGMRARDGVDVSLRPSGGCPGPVAVPLGDNADLIVLDTQWWIELRATDKARPDNNPAGCPYVTDDAIQRALLDLLEQAAESGRATIVAGHHPLKTVGAHSGFVDPWTHVFPATIGAGYVPFYVQWLPLPLVGSAMAGFRACCSPSAQDMPNRHNRAMRAAVMQPMIEAAVRGAAPLAYAAGHDHSLQVFRSSSGPAYVLVSGLGSSSKASVVGSNRDTLFAHANRNHPGFMQLDFLADGRVRLAVIEFGGPDLPAYEVYSRFLAGTGS